MASTITDQVSGAQSSLAVKAPCRVATTANITLSGLQTIDGVALASGDSVLVKNQTDTTQNGVYVASSGNWQRRPDMDGNTEAQTGTQVRVNAGSTQSGLYVLASSADPAVIGTSTLSFALDSAGSGGAAQAAATAAAASASAAASSASAAAASASSLLLSLAGYVPFTGGTSDVDLNGHQLLGTTSLNGGAFGGRNLLNNSSFQVAQRGASIAISSTTAAYTVDQWAVSQGSGTVAITAAQQSAPETGAPNSIRVQRNSANTNTAPIRLTQVRESIDVRRWQGKSVTLSFRAKKGANYSPTSSLLASRVITGTGADQGLASMLAGSWTGQATTSSQNNTLTTSFQTFTQTLTIPSGCTELAVDFQMTPTGTASTNDWFEIDSVQLEPGSQATTFEQRPYAVELAICQRYLLVRGGQHLFETITAGGYATSSTVSFTSLAMPVPMRATPSLTVSSVSHFAVGNGAGGRVTCTGLSLSGDTTSNVVSIEGDTASGLTAGRPADIEANNTTSAQFILSAEL